MATTGQKGLPAPAAAAAARRRQSQNCPLRPVLSDSFHCQPGASGSAAQFNRSVSAMPATTSKDRSRLPSAGTADYTLLLGSRDDGSLGLSNLTYEYDFA
jgi:hypothetical protein